MKKVITYGTYDRLHYGHINLLRRAKELGDYLIVGVTTDNFDINRGKMSVSQPIMERIRAVQETGYADLVIPEEYLGQKIDDIIKYDVDIFAIGSDWKGYFDYLKDFCDVVYLDRTEGVSSTQIRKQNQLKIGVIGYPAMADKFINELKYINELKLQGVYLEPGEEKRLDLEYYGNRDLLISDSDAVYIISEPSARYDCVKQALLAGKHVLCESPVALRREQAEELFAIAAERQLVLFEGLKTAYAIAFNRLRVLVQSEWIGSILSVEARCTSLRENSEHSWGSFETWGSIGVLPVLSILGTDYEDLDMKIRKNEEGKDLFTCLNFTYPHAVASVKVATGAKSEGDLVITGTKGYVYVPSPWWKTEYFELRYEDSNNNKRHFYKLEGEGIRYELAAFAKAIRGGQRNLYLDKRITLKISELMESFFAAKEDEDNLL